VDSAKRNGIRTSGEKLFLAGETGETSYQRLPLKTLLGKPGGRYYGREIDLLLSRIVHSSTQIVAKD
jgi:hypothetical protein